MIKTFVAILLLGVCIPAGAQENYLLSECSDHQRKKGLGERLRITVPKGARTEKGGGGHYWTYDVGFGKKNFRVWMNGIFGHVATSGKVPKYMLSETLLSNRVWSFQETEGVDVKGRLGNGNYWRYLGTFGESIKYFDVPKDAADFFDIILDGVCYNPPKH